MQNGLLRWREGHHATVISDLQGTGTMGKEQELLQAVKNGDLPSAQKLVAKVKASRSSESSCFLFKKEMTVNLLGYFIMELTYSMTYDNIW